MYNIGAMSTGTVIAESLSVRATMRHSMKYPWSLFEAVSMFDGFSSITLPSVKLWNFESEPAIEAKDHRCLPLWKRKTITARPPYDPLDYW